MKVKYYKMRCQDKRCDNTKILISAKDVDVTLDLLNDKYIFIAICPQCGSNIEYSRKVF